MLNYGFWTTKGTSRRGTASFDVRVLALGDWKYTKKEKIAEAKRCVKSRMRRTKSRIRSVGVYKILRGG